MAGQLDADPVTHPFGTCGGPLFALEAIIQAQRHHHDVRAVRGGEGLSESIVGLVAPWGVRTLGDVRAPRVEDPGLCRDGPTDSLQKRHRDRREAVVIAQQDLAVIRIGADHGDAAQVFSERQERILVFQ